MKTSWTMICRTTRYSECLNDLRIEAIELGLQSREDASNLFPFISVASYHKYIAWGQCTKL